MVPDSSCSKLSLPCRALAEPPPPPSDGIGWPWAGETPRLPASVFGRHPWPRISIVTPSYNQSAFLEETIRSVLLQGYPSLEYIVIDGGSSDDSVRIIRKYERWLDYWVSESDRGQADALRKGFRRAQGELIGWINSDDLLAPNALRAVAEAYVQNPFFGIYAGVVENFEDGHLGEDHEIIRQQNITFDNLLRLGSASSVAETYVEPTWHQPGIFFSADLYRRSGEINPNYFYRMDYDLLLRMLENGGRVIYLNQTLAYFRKYPQSKMGGVYENHPHFVRYMGEKYEIASRYLDRLSEEDRARIRLEYLKVLWRGTYLNLVHGQPARAATCLSLGLRVGGLDAHGALFLIVGHRIFRRLAHLLRSWRS